MSAVLFYMKQTGDKVLFQSTALCVQLSYSLSAGFLPLCKNKWAGILNLVKLEIYCIICKLKEVYFHFTSVVGVQVRFYVSVAV